MKTRFALALATALLVPAVAMAAPSTSSSMPAKTATTAPVAHKAQPKQRHGKKAPAPAKSSTTPATTHAK